MSLNCEHHRILEFRLSIEGHRLLCLALPKCRVLFAFTLVCLQATRKHAATNIVGNRLESGVPSFTEPAHRGCVIAGLGKQLSLRENLNEYRDR